MNPLKKLLGQTAVYGLSNIVGRLLNYFLVPLHVRLFLPNEYGVVGDMYAYAGFLFVLLTFGMETAFFRFSESESEPKKVYTTALIPLIITSLLFVLLVWFFIEPITSFMRYKDHYEYIIYFAIISACDAASAIPFALLRQQNRAMRFATIKSSNIVLNIGLNLILLLLLPFLLHKTPEVGSIFLANVVASAVTLVLLLPEFRSISFSKYFDKVLFNKMLRYAMPLLVMGVASIANETLDRILLKRFVVPPVGEINPNKFIMWQLGVYNANYKIAILMTLFIQTFRYAAEPFFFSQAKDKNSKQLYADVMKFFVLFCLLIFVGIMVYIEPIKHFFIKQPYYEGIRIVPILLMANLCLGVIYNLSIWYKLNNKTYFGAYIALFGAAITVILNIILIPKMGYMGSAWATFVCYFATMVLSYFLGQLYYPIAYPLKKLGVYTFFAFLIYWLSMLNVDNPFLKYSFHTLLVLLFVGGIVYKEKLYLLLPRFKNN